MNLIANVTKIAACIYRVKYRNGQILEPGHNLDWSANYSQMLGFRSPKAAECFRGYFTIHSDHSGGNVSAHACHLVSSALADPYLSFSACMNGLAGPLHGLANQECVKWLLDFSNKYGYEPSDNEIIEHINNIINRGGVIPGYGHAVLRDTDPRFTHLMIFA